MDVFLELNRLSWENEGDTNSYNVCVGKEWHRFPSSFFLPNKYYPRYTGKIIERDNTDFFCSFFPSMKLLFIASEFRGQLPRPFDPPPNGTWTLPPHMNDLNKEEPSRYVMFLKCHADAVFDVVFFFYYITF